MNNDDIVKRVLELENKPQMKKRCVLLLKLHAIKIEIEHLDKVCAEFDREMEALTDAYV